jgi:spore germination protein KA
MKFLDYFKNIWKRLAPKKDKKKIVDFEDLDIDEREDYINELEFRSDLEENINMIKDLLGGSCDFNIRRFKLGAEEISGALIYMSGLTDTKSIEEILESLEMDLLKFQSFSKEKAKASIYDTITNRLLNNKNIQESSKVNKVLNELSLGSSAIFINGISNAILCETKGFQVRNVTEPESEKVIRGPRDGFVENIFVNTSLLRQRIRVPHFWIQDFEIGSLSKTQVAMAYIKGLASEELVDEVRSRLEKIDIDTVLESGYLQGYLHDKSLTVFPLIMRTERPDKVVSCLVEGKVAILTNGTPFVLTLPTTFNMYLQSPDDYYELSPITSIIRMMRYLAYIFSILLPGLYVAVLNFHAELLPSKLFLRIAATRGGIPFPIVIEALIMGGLFEFLREAGLRLPKAAGSAISIVGALVLGDAAIKAGLASPPMVIIVAITAISSFTIPRIAFGLSARIFRFIFLFLGGTIGMFGIQFGIIILLIHLCSLRSFGQPYLQPFAPLIWQDLKDSLVRLPWWQLVNRPFLLGGREEQRQKGDQKPDPSEEGE